MHEHSILNNSDQCRFPEVEFVVDLWSKLLNNVVCLCPLHFVT